MATLKGFPERFKGSTADECEGEGWLDTFIHARRVILQGGIAVFVGDCGVGKTRMSYELAKIIPNRSMSVSRMVRQMPAVYTTADQMLDKFKQSFGNEGDAPSEKTSMEGYTSCTLLVIDEIDSSIRTDFAQRKLKRIVDERYMAKLPTILITNEDRSRLKQLLPKPVISRIRETGKGFHFDWPSFRDRDAAAPAAPCA